MLTYYFHGYSVCGIPLHSIWKTCRIVSPQSLTVLFILANGDLNGFTRDVMGLYAKSTQLVNIAYYAGGTPPLWYH